LDVLDLDFVLIKGVGVVVVVAVGVVRGDSNFGEEGGDEGEVVVVVDEAVVNVVVLLVEIVIMGVGRLQPPVNELGANVGDEELSMGMEGMLLLKTSSDEAKGELLGVNVSVSDEEDAEDSDKVLLEM